MTTEAEKKFTPLNEALSQLFGIASGAFKVTFEPSDNLTADHLAFNVNDEAGEKRGEIAFNPYDQEFTTSVSAADDPNRTATIHMSLQRPAEAKNLPVLTFQETAALISLSIPAFQHILAPK
ncbi:MAG TPA: hypothetical protein VL625_09020 [Patescibacteria group bacterium]|nr:hypothetical protein [Patescibacteria group bacterium]